MSGIEKVNLAETFARFTAHWSPKVVSTVNDCQVKLVKFQGEFVWHSHADEDELFLVVKGRFTMRLRDRDIEVREGEFITIPRGVEHKPEATEEVWVLLVEPGTTVNTGAVRNEKTVLDPERI